MLYAIGFGMILAMLFLGFLYQAVAAKISDMSGPKQKRHGARCPCPDCGTELYDTIRTGARGLDRRGLKCNCGAWSEWEVMGDPPVLHDSRPAKAAGH